MNIGQMLTNAARRWPDSPAVSQGARTITYRQFDERSNALAHALADLGLVKGDRVGVLMRNRAELLEAMYACFKAGYCLVPLNSRFTSEEVGYHAGDSGAKAIVTDDEGEAIVQGAGLTGVTIVVTGEPTVESSLAYESMVERGAGRGTAVVDVERDDLAWLFYTSGTTGRPKGAMLTHGNLSFVVASWLADLTPMDERDAMMHAAPLSHGAGFHALAATARGSHQILPADNRFDPLAVVELMQRERITNTWLVPTQIVMLIDALGDSPVSLPDLRAVVYGGAPFAPAELQRAIEVFGPVFVQLFAQGETPMTATVFPAHLHAEAIEAGNFDRLASAGFPRPGMDVRVLGPDDRELTPGEVGEVCVRGPAVMLGYWQRPEATAETMRNGWLHTGDLGRIDADGWLYLLDRAKDLIITGGSNVYAVEVEAAMIAHEAVRDVAVIGLQDRTWGEVVVAVVVTDRDDHREVERALSAHCRETLAGYKQPRRFHFIEALPRNAYGKVLKRELRERFS